MASYRVYRYTGISKEDEKADVKRGMEAELRERDTWQVFSSRWFNNWKKSVGFDQIESPEQVSIIFDTNFAYFIVLEKTIFKVWHIFLQIKLTRRTIQTVEKSTTRLFWIEKALN